MLDEPFSRKGLASFVDSVRKRMYVHGVRVFDGDERMIFVKSGLISG